MDLLPLGCGCWCKLLFQQWKHMNRWIVFDKTVHPVALQVSHGVPQGDPAGPLIMNLLMSALMRIVDKRLQLSPSDFFHVLYMDDRTFIGKNKQDVQRAQEIWQEVASRYKLRQNPEKTQTVDLFFIPEPNWSLCDLCWHEGRHDDSVAALPRGSVSKVRTCFRWGSGGTVSGTYRWCFQWFLVYVYSYLGEDVHFWAYIFLRLLSV